MSFLCAWNKLKNKKIRTTFVLYRSEFNFDYFLFLIIIKLARGNRRQKKK